MQDLGKIWVGVSGISFGFALYGSLNMDQRLFCLVGANAEAGLEGDFVDLGVARPWPQFTS